MPNIDFGFAPKIPDSSSEEITNLETGNKEVLDGNGNPIEELDGNDVNNIKPNNEPDNNNNADKNKKDPSENNNNDDKLEEGTIVEIGDDKYTIDKDGNLVDEKGNIFKESKDVAAFIKESEVVNEETEINVKSIIDEIGIQVTDENNKPIEFENNAKGIASYLDSVLDLKRTEYAQAGVQSLIDKYPIITDFLNYYVANGNSAKGFGEQPDRSSITINETNVAQQESIIREAWKESKRPGDVEAYIKYLKDTNTLFDVANSELEALKQNDANIKAELQRQAEAKLKADQEQEVEFWNDVKSIINSKEIAGYKIPDTIIINKNGKKLSATPNDFYNYLYQVDNEGYSRYERDLMAKDARKRNEDNLLAAYLEFTGNGYASLVDLAIADKEAKKLRLKHNETNSRTIKVIKPTSKKTESNIGKQIADSFY